MTAEAKSIQIQKNCDFWSVENGCLGTSRNIRRNDVIISFCSDGAFKMKKASISLTSQFLSLLSDSNQRPRDYKSRALAN